jgi:hypothetical protein
MDNIAVHYILIAVSLGALLGAMIGGVVAGGFYFTRFLAFGSQAIYHAYIINTGFFILLAIARSFETPLWWSWIGIWILYSIFMFFTYLGFRIGTPLIKRVRNETRKIRSASRDIRSTKR